MFETDRLNKVVRLMFTSFIEVYASSKVFVKTKNQELLLIDKYTVWAKRMVELQLRAYRVRYGFDWVVVRPCNIYGLGDNFSCKFTVMISSFMMRINRKNKLVLIWEDVSAIRDFEYIRDVAVGVIQGLCYNSTVHFINIWSSVRHSIRQFLETKLEFMTFNYKFDATNLFGSYRQVMDFHRELEWIEYEPQTILSKELGVQWLQENLDKYLIKKIALINKF